MYRPDFNGVKAEITLYVKTLEDAVEKLYVENELLRDQEDQKRKAVQIRSDAIIEAQRMKNENAIALQKIKNDHAFDMKHGARIVEKIKYVDRTKTVYKNGHLFFFAGMTISVIIFIAMFNFGIIHF